MKRVKILKYRDGGTGVEITVKVHSAPGYLVRGEVDRAIEELSDGIMRSMNLTRYINAPLSAIRVR